MTRHDSAAARQPAAGHPSRLATSPPSLSSIASAIALVFGLAAGQANALSLGPINVQSALGEPLRAEVDLSDISATEAENLRLNIASADAFRQAGIAYNQALAEVRANLQRRADGRYVVRLTGTRPLSEPFVDLLLEANWSSGRIVRDYTLLLDPPSNRPTVAIASTALQQSGSIEPVARPAPPTPASQIARAPDAVTVRPTPAVPPVPTVPLTPPAISSATASAAPVAPIAPLASSQSVAPPISRRITVQRGDTAGEIARSYKPAEISLDQMLLALLHANPDAFIGGNVNRMRSGAVLTLPTTDQSGTVPPAEARQTVIAQSRDFGEYRRRLAENAPTSQVAPANQQATGRLQANVEDRSAVPPSADRLTIAPRSAARGNDEALLRAREAQANQVRLAELSRNINDLNKLATGGPPSTAPASTNGAAAVAAPNIVTPIGIAASASSPVAGTNATGPERTAPPLSANAEAGASTRPAAAPVPERSFIDTLRENQFVILALGLVLLLIVLLAYRIRARRKAHDTDESLFLESSLPRDSFFDATGGESVDTRSHAHSVHAVASSLSYSPSQLNAGDVDPVAEADVYLAYGRDLQAEEILREALRMNPDRTAIHLKLLEIHAKRRDLRAYEALALDVWKMGDGTGSDWQRAREMGKELDPANPLYDDRALSATASHHARTETASAIGAMAAFGTAVTASVTTAPSGPPPAPTPAFMPTVAPLDFDLDLGDEPLAPRPAASLPRMAFPTHASSANEPVPSALPASLQHLPVLPVLPVLDPMISTTPASTPTSSGFLEFDLDALSMLPATRAPNVERLSDAFDADGESPHAIKLSLARELQTLGDSEGARTLAEEVATNGPDELQAEAVRLLSQLH